MNEITSPKSVLHRDFMVQSIHEMTVLSVFILLYLVLLINFFIVVQMWTAIRHACHIGSPSLVR